MKKILCLTAIFLLLSGCGVKENVYSKDLSYMDTFINIKIYDDNKKKVDEAFTVVDAMYRDYDALSDRYKAHDGIKNVCYINNDLPMNTDLVIDERLYAILEYSESYSKVDNHFNIALGNVIDVWKEYRDGKKSGVPTLTELTNSGSIDASTLILKDNNTIMKTSNISLDLGGIAKGFVTELVGDYLDSVGLHKYLITAGTSSVKAGIHYNGDRYKIGLINPNKADDIYKIIKGNNISVTTSGSYERYYEYEGVRYSHLIDPNTLFPPNYVLSVTVITGDAAVGELLSKTLYLMPIEDGLKYIKNYKDVEAIWYGVDGKITMSDGMKKYE